MSAFTRIRAPGFWIAGSVVDPAEFEAIDARYTAINGDGGTYSPSSQLVIGGANGIKFNSTPVDVASGTTLHVFSGATVNVDGTLNIDSGSTSHVKSGGTLQVDNGGAISVASSGALNVASGGLIEIASGGSELIDSGGQLVANGSIIVNPTGTLTTNPSSTTTIQGTLTASGTKTLSGTSTISGTLTQSATTTRTGSITLSGVNAWTARRRLHLTNVDTTVIGTQYDTVRIPQSITTGRKYTLTASPTPPDGLGILFYRAGNLTSGTCNIVDDGAALFQFGGFPSGLSTNLWAYFEYSAALGMWECVSSGGGTV